MATREAFAKLRPLEADSHCGVCGSSDWELYDHSVVVLPVKGHGVLLNDGVPCLVMFCRLCGNARFHSRKVLGDVDD
jgi:hypothetical protein